MNKLVTYSRLSRILADLGFSRTEVKGSHHLFQHATAHATVMLPLAPSKTVAPIYLKAIGRTLDEKGLLGRNEFERMLSGAAAERHASNGHASARSHSAS